MNIVDVNDVIAEFEKSIDTTLDFSEDNVAEVIFNQNTVIGIRLNEDDGTISLSSVIAEDLPDPISNDQILEILTFNCIPGINYGGNAPVIARDKSSGIIFVYEIVTQSLLKIETPFNIFSDFVSYVLQMREFIEGKSGDNFQDSIKSSFLGGEILYA